MGSSEQIGIPPGFEVEKPAGSPAIPPGFEIEQKVSPGIQAAADSANAMRTAPVPHPDDVDRQTTDLARRLADQLTAPPVPPPPLPYELQNDQQQLSSAPTFTNPRTGVSYPRQAPGKEGGPLGVLDNPITGGQRIGQGVEQMSRPTMREKAGGLHTAIGGALEAATPLMVGAGVAAPLATAATVAVGTGAQAGTAAILKKVGIPEEYADVAGDLAGLFAAAKTPKAIKALKTKFMPVLQERLAKTQPAEEPSSNSVGAEPYKPTEIPQGFEIEKPAAQPAQEEVIQSKEAAPEPMAEHAPEAPAEPVVLPEAAREAKESREPEPRPQLANDLKLPPTMNLDELRAFLQSSKESERLSGRSIDDVYKEFGFDLPSYFDKAKRAGFSQEQALDARQNARKRGVVPQPPPEPADPSTSVPEPERQPAGPTTLASGFGALQPVYDSMVKSLKESKEEVSALSTKRKAGLAAAAKNEPTEAQKEAGRTVRENMTGERDLWGTRINQTIGKLKRFLPDSTEQEGLSLMRDFKSRPGELQQFALGTHPDMASLPPAEYAAAMKNLDKLRPAIDKALNPTPKMKVADQVLTHIADMSLQEGQRLKFLDSSITPEDYTPHLLHPKGEGEFAGSGGMGENGSAMGGKIGRQFSFGKERTIPTLAHAVAYGLRPKTLNAMDAFTIHGDKFATARATHMLVNDLKLAGLGKWGAHAGEGSIPTDWVEIAPHAHPFQNLRAFTDNAGDAQIARQTLYVPKFVNEALRPITDPDYMSRVSGYRQTRAWQAAAKAAELSLSLFHAKAENYMALSNMGPTGWAKAQTANMWGDSFLASERDMVLHGGTSPIQGKTYEAYKGLQPGSIPSKLDIIRKFPGVKQADAMAQTLTHFIFDNQMRRFKVTNYALRKSSWLADNPHATAPETSAALHSIAREINAVYGGLHWENLGVNRMTQNVARFMMLAPDWTFSNFFNVKTMAEGGLKGTEGARMSRAFWVRSMVGGMAVTQGYSLLMSGKPSEKPTMAYEGKDKDGREIYRNIGFAGAPSDVVNLVNNVAEYGPFEGPMRSLINKAAPGFHTAFELAFNEDFRHHKIVDPQFSWTANAVRSGIHLAKGIVPIPFTANNVIDVARDGTLDQKAKARDIIGLVIFGQAARHVAPKGARWSAKGGLKPDTRKPSSKSFLDQVAAP